MNKATFALMRGVGPNAVSNWIARGKIHGEALTVDGKIKVEIASQQLEANLDQHRSAARRHSPPEGAQAQLDDPLRRLMQRVRREGFQQGIGAVDRWLVRLGDEIGWREDQVLRLQRHFRKWLAQQPKIIDAAGAVDRLEEHPAGLADE